MSLSPKTEMTRNSPESLVIRSKNILHGYTSLPIYDGIAGLPNLSEWKSFNEGKKLTELRKVLSGELYQIFARYGDDRNNPTADSDGLRNKYHTFIPPWLGQYYNEFGKEKYDAAMKKGLVDPMVVELREKGVLKPGLDPKGEVINVAASTGNTQYLWQYDQGLQLLEEMREIAKGDNWKKIKRKMHKLLKNQDKRLKNELGFYSDDILLRMQSGSDIPLLNALFGSKASQITNETGAASLIAASARDTSKQGGFGHARSLGADGLPNKLKGMEHVNDAIELEMRKKNGETLSSELVRDQTENWIEKERAKNPGCRLTLGVTAGGKTGLEWRGRRGRKGGVDHLQGGLQFDDALALRAQYGGLNGLDILISVDNSQGRLSRSDIAYLKSQNVMIFGTGSKIVEGPAYSAYAYIPPQYKELALKTVSKNPEMIEGLAEYVTRGDLRELLGDKLVEPLFDLPDILSLLKWQSAVVTMEKFANLDQGSVATKVRDLMNNIETKMKLCSTEIRDRKRQAKIINNHTWEVVVNDEITDYEMNPMFELMMPFRIKVDGRYLKEKDLREIHKAMSLPGESGQMINIGQYVSGANVLRIAPGMMTAIGMCEAEVAINYSNEISDAISIKLQEVMETRLQNLSENSNDHCWSDKNRLEWEEVRSKDVYLKVQEVARQSYESLNKKVDAMVEVYAEMLQDEQVEPVALISGKNVAALELIYRSWEASERQGEMQVAFVDQSYILVGQSGKDIKAEDSVYGVLLKSFERYPKTHLNIYGCTEYLSKYLKDHGVDESRYKICSIEEPKTNFERIYPEWYLDLEKIDADRAMQINERHKGFHTDQMLHDLINKYEGKNLAIVRGLGQKIQWGREHTLPISVSDNLDFLGIHPLVGFTEDEIKDWISSLDLPRVKNYIDWLKEIQVICGLDLRFKMVNPQWYSEMMISNNK